MGERGPAPEPIALTLMKGTTHHNINRDAPRPPALLPECPDWLDDEARIEWEEIVSIMAKVDGWLTQVNKTTLAGHCQWYSVWMKAERVLAEEGRFFTSVVGEDPEHGQIALAKKLHPMNRISKEAHEAMMKCDKELGITPARGSSVHVPAQDTNDETGLDRVGA